MNSNTLARLTALIMLAAAPAAYAHPGHESGGFLHGLMHPMLGLDHLLAMAGVGLWAAQQTAARTAMVLVASFLVALVFGFVVGLGQSPLPVVELGIIGSVLLVGMIIAADRRLPIAICGALAAVFALFHGHAHGAEMGSGLSALAFGAGFLLASGLLLAIGWGAGRWSRSIGMALIRPVGVAIAIAGGYLALAG